MNVRGIAKPISNAERILQKRILNIFPVAGEACNFSVF